MQNVKWLRGALVIQAAALLLVVLATGGKAVQADSHYGLSAAGGSGQATELGTAFAENLVIYVFADGSAVSGVDVTFTAPSSGASGTFSSTGTNTVTVSSGPTGLAEAPTFTANNTEGSYSVQASAPNGSFNAFGLTNVDGSADMAHSLSIGDGSNQSAQVNTEFSTRLSATVFDGHGEHMSGVTVTFSAPESGASGTFANDSTTTTATTNATGLATASAFTANDTAGAYTVQATVSGEDTATGDSLTNSFSLKNTLDDPAGVPAVVSISGGSGQQVDVLQAFPDNLEVAVFDGNIDHVQGAEVTFTAPSQGASGTFADGSRSYTTTTGSDGLATTSTFTAGGMGGPLTIQVSASKDGTTASASISLSINPVSSTTTLAVQPSGSSVNGQTVELTADVTPDLGNAVPSGSVAFRDGASLVSGCESVGPTDGTATCQLTSLAVDTYSFSAEYSGDSATLASSSSSVTHEVDRAATTLTLESSAPDGALVGEEITFTASLNVDAPGAGVPSGGITFTSSDGTSLNDGDPVALQDGTATMTTSSIPSGPPTITAVYGGDTNFQGSSDTFAQEVAKEVQTITVTEPAPATATFGENFDVSASGGASGNPVTITTSGACSGGGDDSAAITMTGGSSICTVAYNQAGNDAYEAASEVTSETTALKAEQHITLEQPASPVEYGSSFTVTPASDADLAVSVAATGGCTVATAEGGAWEVTMTSGVDACVLTASQAGNDDYAAAADVQRTVQPERAALTVTAQDQYKTYGDELTFTGTEFTTSALIDGNGVDLVTLQSAGAGARASVDGAPYAITVSDASGTGLDNYDITYVPGELTLERKELSTTGASAIDRPYDGTDLATISGAELVGVVSGDDVHVDEATGTFAQPEVGADIPVTANLSLDGEHADNYSLVQPSGLTASITPLELTGSFAAADKVYDGTIAATVTSTSLPGVIGDDDASLDVTGAVFDSPTVGVDKLVTGDLALSGNEAPNYTLASSTATAHADITSGELEVSFEAEDKTYDGTSDAVIEDRFILTGLVDGDAVEVNGGTASFATSDSGTGIEVTAAGFDLVGPDAGNYVIGSVVRANADILPAELLVEAPDISITYGEPAPAMQPAYRGFAPGDSAEDLVEAPVCQFDYEVGDAVGAYAIECAGGATPNYAFDYRSGELIVKKASATIDLAGLARIHDGTPKAVTVSTNPPGLSDLTITYDGSPLPPINVGSYAVVASLDNSNYQAEDAVGTLVIAEAEPERIVTIEILDGIGEPPAPLDGIEGTISPHSPAAWTVSPVPGSTSIAGVGTQAQTVEGDVPGANWEFEYAVTANSSCDAVQSWSESPAIVPADEVDHRVCIRPAYAEPEEYVLHMGWNLITWSGADEVLLEDIFAGEDASTISDKITAIFEWDSSTQSWAAYFPAAADIPGASDLLTFKTGFAYWVAYSGSEPVSWPVTRPQE